MRVALALYICVLLAACGSRPVVPAPPEPVAESCAAECRQPCTTEGIEVAIDPDAADAFDQLVEQALVPLRARLQACSDVHRGACVQCLDRLKAAGVTR